MSEELRLQAVRQFERSEFRYDQELLQTVAYAARLCQVPVAAVTLLDTDIQWIKAAKGLDMAQLPRELSFCTQVIKRNRLLVIADMLLDKRYASHPYVVGGHRLRFYAGFPLTTHQGYRIGTLCVMDHKPHILSAQQQLIFKFLARHAMSVMELKLSFDQLQNSTAALRQIRGKQAGNEVKLRAMFESLADTYFLLGKAGEIVDFNRAAYDFVKDNFKERLSYGRLMTDFLTPAYHESFLFHYTNALNGQRMRLEKYADYGIKGAIWWDCVFEPVYDEMGENIGVSYVARDINERKLFEEKILVQNRLLSRIAEIQSHDYRGPLATILGLMNLIRTEDYVASKEYLLMMQEAVDRLDEKIREVVNIVNDPKLTK